MTTTAQRLISMVSACQLKGEFTDLTLSHEAERFNVHRIIVCPQSKVFHKACTGGFEESFTGVIEMVDVSHLEVKKMVDFFYSMDYNDKIPKENEGAGQEPCVSLLQLHARMFALGDRYDIPGLRDLAVKKYSSRCGSPWQPLDILKSIYDIYGTTPTSVRQLRDAVGALVRENLPRMLRNDDIVPVYEEVLTDIPEFTKDLLGLYVRAPVLANCNTCGSNQAMKPLQAECEGCGCRKYI